MERRQTMEELLRTAASCLASAAAGYLIRWATAYYTDNSHIKLGIQALLRDRMLQKWDYCRNRGYAPISDKGSFEAMHASYSGLGSNGVMDKVYNDFMSLPEEK